MNFDLTGRNVIVTGASRGLGRYLAEGLWTCGANLFLVARNGEALAALVAELRGQGRPQQLVQAHVVDLADDAGPEEIIGTARRMWDRLDVLINNAAILGPVGKCWENAWEQWRQTIQVDLLTPVALCRATVPWMLHGGGGRIVNLAGGGATGPRPQFSAYATAKAGLVRFSETLAAELARTDVFVNCVSPGALNTDMAATVRACGPAQAGAREYEQARALTDSDSRVGAARAVGLVAFLASPQAAGITGRVISAVWDPWEGLAARCPELRGSDIYTLRRIVPRDRGKDWQ